MKKFKRKKPRKNDKVENPYADVELNDGTIIPKYGIVDSVKNGVCYVNFFIEIALYEYPVEDLVQIKEGIWTDKYEI